MRKHTKRFLLAGLALTIAASPAYAQGGLMVGGGLTMPRGDYADAVKSGFHGMAGLNFGVLGAPLGIRAEAAYHLNDFDLPGDPDASSALIAVSGDAVYTFPSVGAKPYVLGGITWGQAKCSGDDCVSDNKESDTGFNVGGGIRFGSIFAEARYISIGGDLDLKVIPITVGLRF